MTKKYLSLTEMARRGYDLITANDNLESAQRWDMKEVIKTRIQAAFADVCLGQGVGLHEASLERYGSEKTLAKYRALDEKEDWHALSIVQLNECRNGFAFFDAEGLRFHLPAYLIADLEGEYVDEDLVSRLLNFGEQFALLNEAQWAAIKNYLEFAEQEPDYASERQKIRHALNNWTEYRHSSTISKIESSSLKGT